jgi:hypothetical protein
LGRRQLARLRVGVIADGGREPIKTRAPLDYVQVDLEDAVYADDPLERSGPFSRRIVVTCAISSWIRERIAP